MFAVNGFFLALQIHICDPLSSDVQFCAAVAAKTTIKHVKMSSIDARKLMFVTEALTIGAYSGAGIS